MPRAKTRHMWLNICLSFPPLQPALIPGGERDEQVAGMKCLSPDKTFSEG